ncbi:Uu.00g051340.m01.CDS01 [Anthostomella pinea]|uniref:peptidyl-tRNA hydrolase n=1 Tax=Anthostomella pinea TaxID=933095 RepID=A0AAI8VSU9_9PEZI|nr:Uu.00g051340.m01.CDS01 [Anthostomella pinea]
MSIPFAPRFLVVSLGNQKPYYDTLHSAGHFALVAAQKTLAPSQPHFMSERYGSKACQASTAVPYTMVQSPTMMNICGPWVAKAWKEMLNAHQLKPSELALVIVHDDLEMKLGDVRIRDWKASHRGHNGVKSTNTSLKPTDFPEARWSRISIGIGRPDERDRTSVSDYVLKRMTSFQRSTLDTKVGPKLVGRLRELHDDWEEENDRETSNM